MAKCLHGTTGSSMYGLCKMHETTSTAHTVASMGFAGFFPFCYLSSLVRYSVRLFGFTKQAVRGMHPGGAVYTRSAQLIGKERLASVLNIRPP